MRARRVGVLIVDDHEVVRRGIRQILSETSDIRVVEEASTGEELIAKLPRGRWDVTLLDISMPGTSGGRPDTVTPNTTSSLPLYRLSTNAHAPCTSVFSVALNASASTRRVSAGAMMPSSHSRAVA